MFESFKLKKRVSELEEQMLKLTRVVESKDLDWEDMRARCKRLLDRTEKAARAVVQSEHPVSTEGDGAVPTVPLTPSQQRMQQLVDNRRRLLGIKREAS